MFFRRRRKCNQQQRTKRRRATRATQLGFELLEGRDLLAVTWMNEGTPSNDSDSFNSIYQASAGLARQIVERAIADWNNVVTNFNYNDPNNPTNRFELTVNAVPLASNTERGETTITAITSNQTPTKATIKLDDDGGGFGWYFDPTPYDDAEFTAIVNTGGTGTGPAFEGSFIDVNASGTADFYRSITHEIGHALGLQQNTVDLVGTKIVNYLTSAGTDAHSGAGLYSFHNASGQYGVSERPSDLYCRDDEVKPCWGLGLLGTMTQGALRDPGLWSVTPAA